MTTKDNINELYPSVSVDEMKRYLGGEMGNKERHIIEEKLLNDPFSAEALAGFETNSGAINDVHQLKENFRIKINKGKNGISQFIKGGLFGSAVIVVVAVVYFIILPNNNNNDNKIAPKESTTTDIPKKSIALLPDITNQEIDRAQQVSEKEQISYNNTVHDQPVMAPSDISNKQADQFIVRVQEDINAMQKVNLYDTVNPAPPKMPRSNRAILYLDHLLVIDYSKFYTTVTSTHIINSFDLNNSHVQSPYENWETQKSTINSADIKTTQIPYIEYLAQTLSLFEKNDFKGALKGLEIIRKQYPDDINALFYGGLCYYNLNKKSRAIAYFQRVQNDIVNTFNQEAQFYEAMTYLKKGDSKNAIEIFKEVVKRNAFYKQRAQEQLNTLNK